ncbi:MAG: DUF1572 family protein, partial [Burkholderiales bacterium]
QCLHDPEAVMTDLIQSIRAEYQRYKALAEGAIAQLDDAQLSVAEADADNSIATICWHVSGNLQSRFTDFLTTDGEKPWRKREEEFERRTVARTDLLAKWEQGWKVLYETLGTLTDEQLGITVTIRHQQLKVHEALHRSLAHMSYHVGQIVYVAKAMRGREWTSLSIPPGRSDAYNQHPTMERPAGQAAATDRDRPRPLTPRS